MCHRRKSQRRSLSLSLTVAETQQVHIGLYNGMGQLVELVQDGPLASGLMHRFSIDASGLPSGSYFYRVSGESFSESRSAMLLK